MASDDFVHQPVLHSEVLDALNIESAGIYVDGTFGRGGHATTILQQLGEDGQLIAFDKDPEAVRAALQRFGEDPRFTMLHGSFSMLKQMMEDLGLSTKVSGLLLDLGVSSPQLDDSSRGFSFKKNGPLDMRMNPDVGLSAAQWLSQASDREIAGVLKEYGEERYAKRIARAIVEARQNSPIETTGQLADIIRQANPAWEKGKDPATRSFQAIRIFINNELDDLKAGLEQSVEVLKPGGRLVVISFHSLEDRIVKRFIRNQVRGQEFPAGLPVTEKQRAPRMRAVGKVVYASNEEVADNPRARSAVMRVAEKLQ